MLINDNSFFVVNENGKRVKCDILFTFDSDETGKSYVVYTDNTHDKDGNVQVYASVYNPKLTDQKLLPIESEKEWKVIEIILEELQQGIRSQIDGKIKLHNNHQDVEEDETYIDKEDETGLNLSDRERHIYDRILKMEEGDAEEREMAFLLTGILGNESLSIDLDSRLDIVEDKMSTFYQLKKYDEIDSQIESCKQLSPSLLKESIIWLSCAFDIIDDYYNEKYYHITNEKWESLLKKTLIKLTQSSISNDEIANILETESTSTVATVVLSNFARYLLSTDNVDAFMKYEPLFSMINYKVTTASDFSIVEEGEKPFTSIAVEYHSNSILFYLIDHDY